MKRREFIKTSGLAIASSPVAGAANNATKLPKRPYGKTGIDLSVVGFGGIVIKDAEQAHANTVVAETFERGVNYFDVAPSYGDAEIKLGPALEPYRKDVFLACKTHARDRETAEMEFNRSLERLRTDHFDLYQLHSIQDVEKDVDAVFTKGGVMDMLVEKQKAGQVRYLGFSAHGTDAALAAMDRFDFDSILFPLNFAAYYEGDFGPAIMKKAQEKGLAILTLKAMASHRWEKNDPRRKEPGRRWFNTLDEPEDISRGLRWTLSQPVTATVPPGTEHHFKMALDIASESTAITDEETSQLKQLAKTFTPLFPIA